MPEEMFTRASAKLTSFDASNRTVDLVLATETPVRRRSWETGTYDEILTVSRQAIDTSRIDGMALLDSHDAYSGLDSRLGSIVAGSLRFEGKVAIVTAKISRNDKGQALFNDLEDGHVLGVSVGYRIDTQEKTEAPAGGTATIRATRWTPLEISIVSVPADAAATTRAHKNKGDTPMPQKQHEQSQDQQQSMTRAERRRVTDIQALARSAKIDFGDDLVTTAIEEGHTLDQFRNAMLDHLIAIEEQSPTFPISDTRGMRDSQETMRRLMANAILHRHGFADKLEDGANQFRDMTAIEIARDMLQQRGENTRGPASEIARRALHSTSDFPNILGDVVRQTLLQAYQNTPNTFQLFGSRIVVPDLRDVKVIEMGNGPELEELTEKGEYKRGTVKESAESFNIRHFGKVIGMTEAMLINDQLGAFARVIADWGRMAAKLEGNIAWAPLLENHKLKSDNKALFHVDHGNLAPAGSALDETNLIAARTAFRKQKDIDGQQIGLTPKYLAVGTELEVRAQQLTAAQYSPATLADSIPQAIRELTPIYEPRIDNLPAKPWFVFSSAADTFGRGLQYAHLAGYETPRTMERYGFDYDGVEYRLDHYFGAGLTDFRFAYKNPGL